MIVMKFGGSSLADASRIEHVASIVQAYHKSKPIVVLSAMGDTTDHLLESADHALGGKFSIEQITSLHLKTANTLGIDSRTIEDLLSELNHLLTGISMIKELTKRTRDYLVSFGERLSVRIMAAYLSKIGISAKFYDAWEAGIFSDSNFMQADLLDEVWNTIPSAFESYCSGKEDAIPIVTGFIAKDKNGTITTLGRGGSDLTATIIGSALGVDEIQTWKDVDGIMTTDPRICSNAKVLAEVTYEEAQELALFGSQVL
ncbi:MAG: aspartate kinase, partial [Treponema sp.]|nr:aspartate kinase [Treponema sp.]